VVFGIFVLLKIREWIPVKGQPTVLEKAETSKDIPDTMAARVINHRHLTPQVLEYTVEIRQELSVIPGQRALFSREDKDGKFNRAYSIADREIDEGKTLLTFTVKIGGGRGTTLLSAVKIGDTLYVKGIFGKFVLQQTDLPKVFIGT
jgi:ferredoxin-NADP reductase